MKAQNMLTKLLAMALTVGMLAGIWSVWGARPSKAVIAIIRQTGVFSLAQGQATSAHAVNTGEARGIVINWTVLDSAGNTLAQSERQTVEMGQASTFEYGTGVYIPEGQRMAIRLVLTVEGVKQNKPGFIATQEVYNTGDGKTTVFLPYIE
jgi:hypothetical protein